jgi:hypothetical protein
MLRVSRLAADFYGSGSRSVVDLVAKSGVSRRLAQLTVSNPSTNFELAGRDSNSRFIAPMAAQLETALP